MKDPIFICGHRKSGTTMFHDLFDGHNDLMVYPVDLNILYAYFPSYLEDNYSNVQRKERLDRVIFNDFESQLIAQGVQSNISTKKFRDLFFNLLEESDLVNMREIVSKLLKSYSIVSNQTDKIPVIKETSIEIYALEISTWFPKSKFLHVIRDPRDNYASLKSGVKYYYSQLGENEKETLASLIHRTRIGLEMGLLNQSKFGLDNYKFVFFEKIVNNLEIEMKSTASFLGIPFVDSLLVPTKLKQSVKGNNFEGKVFKKVSVSNTNKWKDRILDIEAQIIEFHLGEIMEKYGYETCFNIEERIASAAEFYKWQNYRYFFNDRFI